MHQPALSVGTNDCESKVPAVGDAGFQPSDIVRNLSKSDPVKTVLNRKMSELVRCFGICQSDKEWLEVEVLHGRKKTMDVVEWLISDFRGRLGTNATIDKLSNVFKELQIPDAVDILEKMRLAATSEESESTNLLESNVTTYRHDTPAEKITGESEDPLVPSDSSKMAERDVVGMLGHIAYSFHNNPLISKCLWAILIIIVGIVVMCAIFGTNTIFVNVFGRKEDADSLAQLVVFEPTPNSDKSAEVDFLEDCLPEEATSLQVSSFREYEAKILEASSACVHLAISISNPSDWNANSNMPKAELVTSLLINGTISQKLFLSILTQLSQVQEVHINNEKNAFCRNIQKSRDTPVMPHKSTYTSKVKSVKFSDFSLCTHFYKNFGNYLRLDTLVTIGFNNSIITNDNINHIKKIFYGSRRTLLNLEINGTTNASQKFYNPSEAFSEIRSLKLNIISMVNNDAAHISLFDVNFCASFPSLERFESTTGVTYSDILVVLKCKNLKAVIATVVFGEDDGFWNINESIKSKQLRFLKLYFIFYGECPSQQQIQQLGLSEDRNGVKKSVSMNKCSISTENTDSKEVHFVEEYSKT